MYAFGQSLGKSKKGSKMPVNTAAIQRRERPQGGRDVGLSGRRAQDGPKRRRLDVGEESERLLHSLPPQKPQQNRQPHSLSTNIDRNAPNAKKH